MNKLLNTATFIFKSALLEDDITSYYKCRQIVENIPSVVVKKRSMAIVLYLILNTVVLLYEYLYATWFLFYMTPSGFNIIKKLIYSNPVFSVFFYLSFYIKILTEPDIEKFNYVVHKLGLPQYKKK